MNVGRNLIKGIFYFVKKIVQVGNYFEKNLLINNFFKKNLAVLCIQKSHV